MADNVAHDTSDRALADLVDAFGHYSAAEMQAFLDATPFTDGTRFGGSSIERAGLEWPAAAGFAGREAPVAIQAARA